MAMETMANITFHYSTTKIPAAHPAGILEQVKLSW
jgi:hypothetical protein